MMKTMDNQGCRHHGLKPGMMDPRGGPEEHAVAPAYAYSGRTKLFHGSKCLDSAVPLNSTYDRMEHYLNCHLAYSQKNACNTLPLLEFPELNTPQFFGRVSKYTHQLTCI
jgi:hypothetical protein